MMFLMFVHGLSPLGPGNFINAILPNLFGGLSPRGRGHPLIAAQAALKFRLSIVSIRNIDGGVNGLSQFAHRAHGIR